jgi:GNAT superfamily N-acetyltransferase
VSTRETLAIDAAAPGEADSIAALQTRVADHLTRQHGVGHWSAAVGAPGVARAIATSQVLVAREEGVVIATLRLVTKKPWAIDASCFAKSRRPLYLLSMAVEPSRQRTGIGRLLLDAARDQAQRFPADAIRLDAYDSPAGAGGFYLKCGYNEVGRATYRGVPLRYFELLLP